MERERETVYCDLRPGVNKEIDRVLPGGGRVPATVIFADSTGKVLGQFYLYRCGPGSVKLAGATFPLKAILSAPSRAMQMKIPFELRDVTAP